MFAFTAVLAALVASAVAAPQSQAAQCPDASRFGAFTINPTSAKAGDVLTIKADFTCGFQLGYPPVYTDYFIEVPVNNNGFEAPILLARRTFSGNASAPTDTFTAQVPDSYYFKNASYAVQLHNTFGHSGPGGATYMSVGQIGNPITIIGANA